MTKEENVAHADAKLVEATDTNGPGKCVEEPDLLDESEVSLRRRPETSELLCFDLEDIGGWLLVVEGGDDPGEDLEVAVACELCELP
jgi:hypothetical protein